MAQIMVHNTHGTDDVERASLAFVVANTSLAAGQDTTMLLTLEGVRLAVEGCSDGLQADGFPPLADLMRNYMAANGRLWICGACAKPRRITEDDLIVGAQIVGAAAAVEALAGGAQTLSF